MDMDDIDSALARLASEPVPLALGTIDRGVLARISAAPARAGVGVGLAAAAAAVALGIAGEGLTSASPATAAPSLSPFGPSAPLAPSTLLAGIR